MNVILDSKDTYVFTIVSIKNNGKGFQTVCYWYTLTHTIHVQQLIFQNADCRLRIMLCDNYCLQSF